MQKKLHFVHTPAALCIFKMERPALRAELHDPRRCAVRHVLLAWRQGSTRPCRPRSSCHPPPLTMSSAVDHVNSILMALPPVPGRAGRLSLLGQSVSSSSSSRIVLCDGVEQLERPGIRTRWMPVRARWQASSARGPVSIARAAHAVNFSHISSLML